MSLQQLTTPDFGGNAEVSVIEILVKSGDTVDANTSVVTLESDKATMELPAGFTGTVNAISIKVGDKVKTGDLILTVETNQESAAPEKNKKESAGDTKQKPDESLSDIKSTTEILHTLVENAPPVEEKSKASPKKESPTAKVERNEEDDDENEDENEDEEDNSSDSARDNHTNDVHAGPGVRRLARELGVNLAQINGSGPKARILKEDVHQFVKSKLTQTGAGNINIPEMPVIDFAQFGEIETQALSRIKSLTGNFLKRNWLSIPHVTQFGEADITSMEDYRRAQKSEMDKRQIKLTPLVFIMKAVVAALKTFPNFNASLSADGKEIIIKKYFHIGVAVDTPDGLVVPVIRDVDKKGIVELAQSLSIISEKARNKQLLPKDMQGGCFSISSLGGIGGTAFTPIINAPEVAILGVSKAAHKPIYREGNFIPRLMLPLSLSYDHRVIDGADGARFMVHLSDMLSDIRNLLL